MGENKENGTAPDGDTTSRIEIGVDWDRQIVVFQVADKSLPAMGIPLDVFVSTATNVMMQMLQRLAQASKSGIIVAHPGQVPGDLRKRMN